MSRSSGVEAAHQHSHHHHNHSHANHGAQATSLFFSVIAGFAIGFITFASVLYVFPQLGLLIAIIAGIAGGFTEGEVFLGAMGSSVQQIMRGPYRSLKRAFLKKVLMEKLGKAVFLDLSEEMQEAAIDELMSEMDAAILSDSLTIQGFKFEKKELLQLKAQMKRKSRWLTLAMIVVIGTGIGFGAITLTDTVTSLFAFSSSLAPALVYSLAAFIAIVASITYGLMMYSMWAKQLEGNFFSKIWEKLKSTFMPKKPFSESTRWEIAAHCVHCTLKLIGILGIIALSLVVTIAIAGAWLNAGAQCFSFFAMGSFGSLVPSALIGSTVLIWVFYVPMTFIFTAKNSLRSAKKIAKKFISSIKYLFGKGWKWIKELRKREKWWQFFNPFRWLSVALTKVAGMSLLLLHVLAIGVIAGPGVGELTIIPMTAIVATLLAALVEFLGDFHFIVPDNKLKAGADAADKSEPHYQIHDYSKLSYLKIFFSLPMIIKLDDHEEHDHCHDHNHRDIAGYLMFYLTLPFQLIGFGVHCIGVESSKRVSFISYLRFETNKPTDSAALVPTSDQSSALDKQRRSVSDLDVDVNVKRALLKPEFHLQEAANQTEVVPNPLAAVALAATK